MISLVLYPVNLQVAMPAIHLCVIKLEFSFVFSNKVDTEEEEEEEDKEDSPAPTDSVSVEFIDNIIYKI